MPGAAWALGSALELSEDLPDPVYLERWMAEPVKAVFVPTRVFLTNKGGFPVLSKRHQAILKRFMMVRRCARPLASAPLSTRADLKDERQGEWRGALSAWRHRGA